MPDDRSVRRSRGAIGRCKRVSSMSMTWIERIAPSLARSTRWGRALGCRWTAGAATAGILLLWWAAAVNGQSIDFARDIRPLLSDRCFACHGPSEADRQADLRLDDLASVLSRRDDRPILVPGNPQASLVWQRITAERPDERMPPPDAGIRPLDAAERERIRQWIAAGAAWQEHWAYRPPRPAPVPASVRPRHAGNWIDAFIADELQRRGGTMSQPADPVTLARRMALDLTGLPPDARTLRSLRADPSEERFDRFVDQLLASPAFGERMAAYWLDLVRYADTVGYHGDQDHNASPYRDYVIDALNDNKPFDQFSIEQLAGDLLPEPAQEQRIATAYNRLLQTSHEGGIQPKEYLAIYAADRVRNLSAVWMGATVGCAQCHDHKYDPYTSEDFYALQAFFADIDEAQHFRVGTNSLPTKRPPEIPALSRQARLQLDALEQERLRAERGGQPERAQELEQSIERLRRQSARMVMITRSIPPREIRLLPRGNWLDDSGPVMEPQVPAFLGRIASEERPTRLDLARWLVDPQDGIGLLTARVMANRLWYLMFGQGLSPSVDDFGGQGQPPSHPELLDRLALEFVASGWDIKHMLRLITSSHAYRQASLPTDWQRRSDPTNRWLSRQNRFRLPAEMIRDSVLSVSGLLVREFGGPGIKPYQPAGYYRHLNFPARTYQASRDENQWRRGVYMHWQRQFLHPMLRAFDAPSREECTATRPASNTPLAALVGLNDPTFVEAARALALQFIDDSGRNTRQDQTVMAAMFEHCTGRSPTKEELRLLNLLLQAARDEFQQSPEDAARSLEVGFFRRPSQRSPVEQAAWTTVARALLNLSAMVFRD